MEIKPYTVAGLRAALSSNHFWRTATLPITKHKAASQIRNPRAEESDIVLLVAYLKNEVVGYLGVLPDKIFIANGTYKLGWLTGWWVDSRRASAGVGTALLFKALNAYRQQLGVSGSSKAAGKVLKASRKFISIAPLKGIEIAFDDDPAANRQEGLYRNLSYEYISSIDKETEALITKHNRPDLTRKGKTDLEWLMSFPWILSAPQKDNPSRRYYFSSIAARFSYLGVKVYDRAGSLVGFFILKTRDDRISLIFSYFGDADAEAILAAVLHHARLMQAGTLSLYEKRLSDCFLSDGCPVKSKKPVSREFLLTKPFADKAWAGCRLQGGDGDLAFY